MALTMERFVSILCLSISLTLIALSTAIFYLTVHGMQIMDSNFPPARYDWYRGPSYDPDTKHKITLRYNSANEGMILAAGAVSFLAGLVSGIRVFVAPKISKSTSQRSTLLLLILPGIVTLLVTLIALIFTSVIFTSNNNGACFWENGYIPNNTLICTRELAACNIGMYFINIPRWSLSDVCGNTQTGRHLVAPAFVASVLLFGLGTAILVVGRRTQNSVGSADDRVERLQREERRQREEQ